VSASAPVFTVIKTKIKMKNLLLLILSFLPVVSYAQNITYKANTVSVDGAPLFKVRQNHIIYTSHDVTDLNDLILLKISNSHIEVAGKVGIVLTFADDNKKILVTGKTFRQLFDDVIIKYNLIKDNKIDPEAKNLLAVLYPLPKGFQDINEMGEFDDAE
jgi:hypothetical protein